MSNIPLDRPIGIKLNPSWRADPSSTGFNSPHLELETDRSRSRHVSDNLIYNSDKLPEGTLYFTRVLKIYHSSLFKICMKANTLTKTKWFSMLSTAIKKNTKIREIVFNIEHINDPKVLRSFINCFIPESCKYIEKVTLNFLNCTFDHLTFKHIAMLLKIIRRDQRLVSLSLQFSNCAFLNISCKSLRNLMRKCKSLKSLHFKNTVKLNTNLLSILEYQRMMKCFASLYNLEQLNFEFASSFELSNSVLALFADRLVEFKKLKGLAINASGAQLNAIQSNEHNNNGNYNLLTFLFDRLQALAQLERLKLNFSKTFIMDQAPINLFRFLHTFKLRSISLNFTLCSYIQNSQTIQELADFINTQPKLHDIQFIFSHCHTIKNSEPLLQSFYSLEDVREISLDLDTQNGVENIGLASLARAIQEKNWSNLNFISMDFSRSTLEDYEVEALAKSLPYTPKLRVFRLKVRRCQKITSLSISALAANLCYLQQLVKLTLSLEGSQLINEDALLDLSERLVTLKNIAGLELNFGKLQGIEDGSKVLTCLSYSISQLRNLRHLKLIFNEMKNINTSSCLDLANNLTSLKNMQELELQFQETNLIDNDVITLFDSISTLQLLHTIVLNFKRISYLSDSSLKHLPNMCVKLKKLGRFEVDLARNHFSRAGISSLLMIMQVLMQGKKSCSFSFTSPQKLTPEDRLFLFGLIQTLQLPPFMKVRL